MRFFKTADISKLTRQIAAEVINITYGETFFDINGNILEEKISGHNVYVLDTVEYAITPNYGRIHILNEDIYKNIRSNFSIEYNRLFRQVIEKFGTPKIPVAYNGTTQYMCITQPFDINNSPGSISFIYDERDPTIPDNINFVWYITSKPIPISDYTIDNASALYSLSSIVVETTGQITLEDGFKGPNYPSYKDYKKYSDGQLLIEPINFHPAYGIHLELSKHYSSVIKSKNKFVFSNCTRPIKLVNWEWIKPYSINSDSMFDWARQIQMGLIDTEPNEEVTNNCIVTNMPIYDDCYVFDIIERMVEETIEEKNLTKYPGAIIVNESTDLPDKNTKSKTKPKPDPESETETKPKTKPKTETKPETKSIVKKIVPKPAMKPESTKLVVNKVTPKIIKRGSKEPTKMIKILYPKKYDNPKCVLISPYFMHLFGLLDAVSEFEKITKTKVLVYRTKSPKQVTEVISNSSANELTKNILVALYNGACASDYQTLEIPNQNIYLNFHYVVNRINSEIIINMDNNIIYGHYVSY